MSTYVITKKHTFDVGNEVFFAYSLQEAINYKESLTRSYPDVEWLIATVLE